MNIKSSLLMAGLAVGVAVPTFSIAAPITAGNLVIYRVGTPGATLGTSAASVFIDEYTTSGSFVQSIAVSDTGSSAMTAVGNSGTEGTLGLSQDGSRIVMGGYRINTGGASPLVAAVNRVIGTVDLSGSVNTSVAITDAGTTGFRSATTVNGSSFYIATASAVRYVATPGGASTSAVIDARNSRQVRMFDNVLYGSNGSTAVTGKLQSYGVGPVGVTVPSAVATLATADAIHGFTMLDMDSGIAGNDTAYALSTVENLIRKYTFNGSTWSASGSVSAGGAQNIVAGQSGGNAHLFMTTASTLRLFNDTSGFGNNIAGGATSVLATAGAGTAFRGVSGFNVVPEPASLVALGLGLALALRKRK